MLPAVMIDGRLVIVFHDHYPTGAATIICQILWALDHWTTSQAALLPADAANAELLEYTAHIIQACEGYLVGLEYRIFRYGY